MTRGENMEYKRNCPDCNKELTYTDVSNFKRAVKNNSVCSGCRKMPASLKSAVSDYWKGTKKPNYKRSENPEKKYSRSCPGCGEKLFYSRPDNYKNAVAKNTKCNH